jgi:flagellar protein FliO/FliZ
LLAAALLALPGTALAQAATGGTKPLPVPSGGGALAQVSMSLVLVLVLIAVLAWAARRLRIMHRPGSGALSIIADLPLGPRDRVVLVRVGDRQALLGLSAGGITSLSLLDSPVTLEAATPAAPVGTRPQPDQNNASVADRLRALIDQGGRRP